MSDISISGTGNPYDTSSYTVESNDKNTLTMTDYFSLLAVQLQNQDITNPMDSSELMNQLTQMAMVQSLSSMTDAMKNSTAVNTQTYAAGLIGQEVTVAVTEENSYGQETMVGVKYGRVEYVNFTTGNPTFKLEGDPKEYQLSHLLGVGRVPDSFGGGAIDTTTPGTGSSDAVEELVNMIVDRLSEKTQATDKPGTDQDSTTDDAGNDQGVGDVDAPESGNDGGNESGGEVEGSGSGAGTDGPEGDVTGTGSDSGREEPMGAIVNPDAGNSQPSVETDRNESGVVSGVGESSGSGSSTDENASGGETGE